MFQEIAAKGNVTVDTAVTGAGNKTGTNKITLTNQKQTAEGADVSKTYSLVEDSKGNLTATVVGYKTNTDVAKVPDTVKYDGKTYNVTTIAKNAFNGVKVKTITVGKNVGRFGKDALKGTWVETIKFDGSTLNGIKFGKNALKGINKNVIIYIKTKNKEEYVKLKKKLVKAGVPAGNIKRTK